MVNSNNNLWSDFKSGFKGYKKINNAQTVRVLQYFLQIKVPDIILLSQLFSQLTSLHQ